MKLIRPFVLALFILFCCCGKREEFTIHHSPDIIHTGQDVLFSSSHFGGDWSYNWDFGDLKSDITYNGEAHHTYQHTGSYTVNVSIFSDSTVIGCTAIHVDVQR